MRINLKYLCERNFMKLYMINKYLISSISKNNIIIEEKRYNKLSASYKILIIYNINFNQDGNIGSELVIRPLPDRILHEVIGKNSNLHREELLPNVTRSKRNLKRTNHHVVYKKVNRSIGDEHSDYSE